MSPAVFGSHIGRHGGKAGCEYYVDGDETCGRVGLHLLPLENTETTIRRYLARARGVWRRVRSDVVG